MVRASRWLIAALTVLSAIAAPTTAQAGPARDRSDTKPGPVKLTAAAGSAYIWIWGVRSGDSNMCLQPRNRSTADGAGVVLAPCGFGAESQRWRRIDLSGGRFEIASRHSGRCLEVSRRSAAGGALVVQRTCDGNPRQQWRNTRRGLGLFFDVRDRYSNRCLDVLGGLATKGARVVQATCQLDRPTQRWRSNVFGPPFYR